MFSKVDSGVFQQPDSEVKIMIADLDVFVQNTNCLVDVSGITSRGANISIELRESLSWWLHDVPGHQLLPFQ